VDCGLAAFRWDGTKRSSCAYGKPAGARCHERQVKSRALGDARHVGRIATHKEPQAIESLMLAFGKALHLTCEFDVLRVFNIGEMFRTTGDAEATFAAAAAAKGHLLAQTIVGTKKIRNY
jgi:hypothetical protein